MDSMQNLIIFIGNIDFIFFIIITYLNWYFFLGLFWLEWAHLLIQVWVFLKCQSLLAFY